MKPFLYQTNFFYDLAKQLQCMEQDVNKKYSHISVVKRFPNDGGSIGIWTIEALEKKV